MTLVIAHRGFSGRYPENTLLSIRKAVELGVDWVECDVHLTKDNQLIVLHDRNTFRTTRHWGRISRMTLAQIKKYKTRKKKQPIPTLEEVYDAVRKSRTKLNVEIKGFSSALKVANFIKQKKAEKKVMVSSTNISSLLTMLEMNTSIKTALVFHVTKTRLTGIFYTAFAKLFSFIVRYFIIMKARIAQVDYVHPSYPFATKSFIKQLHNLGYKVNVWTIDTRALMRKIIARGADGIITNRPDLFRKVLKEKPKSKKKRKLIKFPRLRRKK